MQSVDGSIVDGLLLASALALSAVPASGQTDFAPEIEHDGMGSISSTEFSELEAYVTSEVPILSAKLHFRAVPNRDFHFVLMKTSGGGRITAVPPVPSPSTEEVEYFIEVVNESFVSTRTEVFVAPARPGAAEYPYVGAEPEILIGKVRQVGPALPPGFQVRGVVGVIGAVAAAGAASAVGGGVGLGTAVIAGTATAGAVGGVALTVRDNTVDPPPPPPAMVSACFDINPPVITAGDTVRFNGGCSTPNDGSLRYTWGLGDGRAPRQGQSISLSYRTPDTYTIELTATDGNQSDRELKELVVRPGELKACFTASPSRVVTGETVTLDGRCSTGAINSYQWDLGDGRVKTGSVIQTVFVEPDDGRVGLTVSDGQQTDRVVETIPLSLPLVDLRVVAIEAPLDIDPVNRPCDIAGPLFNCVYPSIDYLIRVRNEGTGAAKNVKIEATCNICSCSFPSPLSSGLECLLAGANGIDCLAPGDTEPWPQGEDLAFAVSCTPNRFPDVAFVVNVFSDSEESNASNNRDSAVTTLNFPARTTLGESEVAFSSALEVEARNGDVSASVSVNASRTFTTSSASPASVRLPAERGTNVIEGVLLTESLGEGRWRFDFSRSANLVLGSLKPLVGDVVSVDGRSVVFRIAGRAGERVKFSFDLKR